MARVNLGAPWRLPTKEEFKELYDNCTSVWTTLNGVAGYIFTSNVNGNSIFIPAAGQYVDHGLNGFYWSSSYLSETQAYALFFRNSSISPQDRSSRYRGFTVRAVQA